MSRMQRRERKNSISRTGDVVRPMHLREQFLFLIKINIHFKINLKSVKLIHEGNLQSNGTHASAAHEWLQSSADATRFLMM